MDLKKTVAQIFTAKTLKQIHVKRTNPAKVSQHTFCHNRFGMFNLLFFNKEKRNNVNKNNVNDTNLEMFP
jgi:hypothetical protein